MIGILADTGLACAGFDTRSGALFFWRHNPVLKAGAVDVIE